MKAKLIFSLPKEQQEFERCTKASDMTLVLWEFARNSRKTIEREFENNTENNDVFDGIERCFEHFYKLLEGGGVNIDEIYS